MLVHKQRGLCIVDPNADNTIEKLKIVSENPKKPKAKKQEPKEDLIHGQVKNLIVLDDKLKLVIELDLNTGGVQYNDVDEKLTWANLY